MNENNNLLKIIRDYSNGTLNESNCDKIIESLREEDFQFFIKTFKYDGCIIDYLTAKRILNFQNYIFKIIENILQRKLTAKEKDKLTLQFSIERGCTKEKPENLFDKIKEILTMLPEKDRPKVLVAIVIAICFCFFIEFQNNKLEQEERLNDKKIISIAMDKLSNDNDNLVTIIKQMDKNNLNNLAEYENINVNNKIFTSEEIEKIKNSRYPKEKKDKKLVSIKGNFIVTQINIKNQYIIVENKNNDDLMRIYYCTDLIGAMQGFKDKFKQAIDDEGKEFYIEASYFLNKKNEITLIKIQEIL